MEPSRRTRRTTRSMTRKRAATPTPTNLVSHEELMQEEEDLPRTPGQFVSPHSSDDEDFHTVDEDLRPYLGKTLLVEGELDEQEYSNILEEMERTQENPFQSRPTYGESRLFTPRTPEDIQLRYSESAEPEDRPLVDLTAPTPLKASRNMEGSANRSNAYPSMPQRNSNAFFIPTDELSENNHRSTQSLIEEYYEGDKQPQPKGK
jgi:hypothetical protein